MPDLWAHQYLLLDYVDNNAFSGVMGVISIEKLLLVIGGLPDNKTVNLFGISNKLWKHNSNNVIKCFLELLNTSE
ncbi:hypothetical protein G9A89_003620 [Geosiphon pyriformis]|nr:hypothetical protein G9A89_003620 [Geosiphon pyriformis]